MASANLDQSAQNAYDTIKFARLVKQTYGRSSLTRSAKDTIAQFPVIFSADVPTDDAVILAKALEAQYASLLVSVISAHSDYDRAKYDNPADYLRSFHNNSSIPSLFMSMDSQLPEGESILTSSLESAQTMYKLEKLVDQDLVMECWLDDESMWANQDSLNSTYRPAEATQKVMESVVANLRELHKPAQEAVIDDIIGATGNAGGDISKDVVGAPTKSDKTRTTIRDHVARDEQGNIIRDRRGNPVIQRDEVRDDVLRAPAATGRQEVVRNDRLTSLEPTLINLQLNSHHGNAPVITHNVVMGVKAMIRQIPQQFMISNLADGVNNSRKIFTFAKWTEGEYKIGRDLILGVDAAKETAVSDRDMRKWLGALKRRKMSNLIGKLFNGEGLPPLTTVVCTTYEVARVAELTGMDLNEPYTAAKLLSKYYLLGFMIYDPETARLKALFDGDTNFSVTTLSGLKTKQQKDLDLVQYTQFIRAAGRM